VRLAAFLALALLAGPALAAPPAKRAPAPKPAAAPAPPLDPVRAQYEAATAPGLGDTVRTGLNRFLAAHPRHALAPSAQFELGLLAYARGEYAEARERFRRARSGPGTDEARYWEGLSAFALGRPRDARDAVLGAARAGKAVPRRWDSAYLVALSWAQEGRRPEALAAYRALFELPAGPAQAAALYQAQRLAKELERDEEAVAWGRKLLASYPQSPEAASFRAETVKPAPPAAGTSRKAPAANDPARTKSDPPKKPAGR
jgi:tetratricopeptide (TPR) repeat protein